MEPMAYTEMSDLALLELCVWRESRGEPTEGKRGVAHVILNRSLTPSWWNHRIAGSLSRVILFPYQFSSFNRNDPNNDKWPHDDDESFSECCQVAMSVMIGADQDNTDGATYYYDDSIDWPKSWGKQSDYINTLNVGHLNFYKPLLPATLDAQDI